MVFVGVEGGRGDGVGIFGGGKLVRSLVYIIEYCN